MLTVANYDKIRRQVFNDGKSQREVARSLGHSRHTVKKALQHAAPPGYIRTKPVHFPAIEPVRELIDAWLFEDKKRPRKQRHTARRMFDLLRDDYDFKGSYSAVQRYVSFKKSTGGETFFPLVFDPGEEGQVDWGEARAIINGHEQKIYLFCYRLCFSTVCFVYAYLRMNLESFLDGHRRAFEFFEGVPHRSAYDNLKTAVIRVGRGRERTLNENFCIMKSHYLFETRFCNIAAGWEKGHVENLVKHAQRTFMTPVPECTEADLSDLNQHLDGECLKDMERIVRDKQKTRRQLFEEEQAHLLPLPTVKFEACKQSDSRVSKQLLVRVDTNDYSVPSRYAYHQAVVKAFVDRIDIFCQNEKIASHARSYDRQAYVLNPQHTIPLLEKKPGGLFNARPFKGEPWGEDFTRLRSELEYRYGYEGTKKFIKVLLLFTEFDEASVKAAVRVCVKRRAFNEDAVRTVLTHEPRQPFRPLDLANHPELAAVKGASRPISVYDSLLHEEVRI